MVGRGGKDGKAAHMERRHHFDASTIRIYQLLAFTSLEKTATLQQRPLIVSGD